MAVYIGSARIDERGNARGGAAGDQNGKEVSTQPWYRHSLGWVVIRAKSPVHRAGLAAAMRAACANPNIGYDQSQRDTLYNTAKPFGFDPGMVTTKCETDCSALVRVCCAYAGIHVASFRTYNEPAVLKATGAFDVLADKKYTGSSDHLLEGDILCTPESGHTVVVLNDGAATQPPEKPAPDPEPPAAETLYTVKRGDTLVKIAKAHGTTAAALMELNGIKDPRALQIGAKLRIAGSTPPPAPETYTVKRGDSLARIAAARGLKWRDLAALNGIKGPIYTIHPGQVLRLR